MSNLISVLDSMFFNTLPRVRRAPWLFPRHALYHPQTRSSEDAYTVTVDMPGVEKEDVSVELNDDVLAIRTKQEEQSDDASGDTKQEGQSDDNDYSNRAYRFDFQVPGDVDSSRLTANLKNGVLNVVLPKSEARKPKKIPVLG